MSKGLVIIRQHNKSNQHYKIAGIAFNAPGPAGTKTRKNVFTAPDYTNGIDVLNCEFFVEPTKAGDKILEAKALVGQVGTLISFDSANNKIVVRSGKGILKNSASGGKIDEGFDISFGVEAYSESTPLPEFKIKRIADPVSVDANYEDVELTLFTFPETDPTAGQNVNLSINFIDPEIDLQAEDYINIGGQTFAASPLPAGAKIQVLYERNGAASAWVKAKLVYLY